MKMISKIRKAMIPVCAILFGACCFGAVASQTNVAAQKVTVEANAETATAITMDWRGTYTNSTTIDYCYIGFAGFTTQDDYSGHANSDYVFQNILINGKSVYEINQTTDVTGWPWDVFPSTAGAKYEKPVLGYIKDTNGRIQLRIHKNLINSCMEKDGFFVITVCEGFSLNGYVVDKETSYRIQDGASKSAEKTPTMDWRGAYTEGTTLDYCYIGFAGFTTQDDYSGNANSDYVFQNLLINGKSIYEINQTTDVTGWKWEVFPSTAGAKYEKPVLGYIKDANGRIQLRIHKNLTNALLMEDGYVRITVKKRFLLNGYIVPADTTFEVMSVQEASPITIDTWNEYPGASQLYYAYLHFDGFNVKDDYSGDSSSDYVLQNINVNGKSIYEINQTTNVTGWTWEIFPQTADAKYCKPILTYTDGAGKLQLRIHKNFYDSIIAEYGAFEISVNENLIVHGYINKTKTTLVKNGAGVFSAPTYVDASTVSVSRWQPLSNAKLTYFDIKYSAFPKLDYQMMDVAAYAYLGNMIEINGVKMSDINNNTNTSGWEWLQFPSTASAVYQKPFVTLINNGSMEVRMHDTYWASIQENGLSITLLSGYYIENNGTMYALNEDVTCKKDPTIANNEFVANGGFYPVTDEENFNMVEGASVRMNAGSAGIRFTAKVSKAYLDVLANSGNTYKLMMQVNREDSDKTAYVECTNSYEDGDYVVYSVAIVNLKESSYTLQYTALPYIEITDGAGNVTKAYTETLAQTRRISDVAYAAYTDISATYDEERYPYEILWQGEVCYSPYSVAQRDVLAGFVVDGVLLSDGVYKFENQSDGNFLMLSDNAEVNAFFAEYADRFVYYYKDFAEAEDYVTDTVVGNASMSWKDWEAESILFMDSLNLNGNDDQFSSNIANANVDKYGYVWEGDSFFGQGWNTPTYVGSRATTSDAFLSDGWEFVGGRKNSAILAFDSGATGAWGACDVDWTVSGNGTFASATVDSGVANSDTNGYFLAHAQNSTYVTYSLEDTRSMYNGVLQAEHSPFVEIGLQWLVLTGKVNEVYLEFKAGNNGYVSLPLSQWATTAIDFSQSPNVMRLYVPVFEHVQWTGKITGLRVKIEGNFTGYFYLDFVRGCYDTRMVDSNTSFISAGKQHFENTGDLAFLEANINNYRKALMFLTDYMSDNGLINLANLVGHNGSAQGFATSFVSTYWDILSLAPNSSYVNALYYKALNNMAYLEDALAANNVTVSAPTVKTTLTGTDVAYTYTATQLREMAKTVKTTVSAELNENAKTGYFKTFTVTINGETKTAGRFIEGYYGDTQIDFGAVALNLMILESGVATEEQKALVLTWMASIDDLYAYTFAPKTNTEDVKNQYCWGYTASEYGVSCQNGGAILFVSYYDIMARAQVYGANDAFERLAQIMSWFGEVKAAFEASGETDAKKFFEVYYQNGGLTLQGRNEEGALGLHAEFIENAILYAAVPNVFFGMDSYYNESGLVVQVKPNLPEEIGTWKMEQVRYAGLVCDVAISNDFVLICNVAEKNAGAAARNTQLEVTLSYSGNTPKVYVNNKLVTDGYTVNKEAKTVTILVDFTNVSVAVQ